MTLDELPVGKTAIITDIQLKGTIKRRLFDLGLIKGTNVKNELRSPMGDPIAYNIRGALIALRKDDTKYIFIEQRGNISEKT